MDGNRRFAKRLMKEPWKGHEFGAKKFEELLNWCDELDVSCVTLYTLSIQNFNRPKHELDYLFKIFRKELSLWSTKESVFMKKGIKVNYYGRLDLLPDDIQEQMKSVSLSTKNNSSYQLNFCIAYGGREELVDAVHNIALDVKDGKISPLEVDIDMINRYVYLSDEPDFIIRTGGDIRTSNFLLWQSAYSEWFFLDKLWPEFEKDDLISCIDGFKSRDRRFGK